MYIRTLFYYRVILTLSTSVYVRSGVSECVCARARFLLLLNSYLAVLKIGFYIMECYL